MIEIRWIGRGGQGAFTAAKILGDAVVQDEKKYALSFPSFGPERRGAPLEAYTKIDTKKITNRTVIHQADFIVVLDETLNRPSLLDDLKPGGKLLLNTTEPSEEPNVVSVDALHIAWNILKRPITNTAMIGALLGISELVTKETICQTLGQYFKNPILEKNISVLLAAYEEVRK